MDIARPEQGSSSADGIGHVPTKGLYGHITHVDFASADPAATRAFCARVFGWQFRPPFPSPTGDYHLFAYSAEGGGGIHEARPDEQIGATAFIHVENAREAFEAALRAGAEAIHEPEQVMPGVTIAMVRAPGGVPIGLSGP
ncbi:MAG: VOC family protein [Gemmatimonadaceae bacterium]